MSTSWSRIVPEGPVLVVAPHPDDETLGCGGLIAAAARQGQRLHIVFITDGGASHPGSREWNRQELAERRESEAIEALLRLGAGNQPRTFLRLKDADMPLPGSAIYTRAVHVLVAILQDFRPQLVLLPWRRDPHRDHRASWQLAMEAVAAACLAPDILEYAIWLDEFSMVEDRPREGEMEEVRFDVSADLKAKRYALAAHHSQLGRLIVDDPSGFILDDRTIARLTGAQEVFWRSCGTR